MEYYRFGPNKPNFTGTDYKWNKLKQEITWWNDTNNHLFVNVICTHCGAKNTHKEDGKDSHLMRDKKGKNIL
jgi:hypothetical protein